MSMVGYTFQIRITPNSTYEFKTEFVVGYTFQIRIAPNSEFINLACSVLDTPLQ
jgi:hypothetical protein